MTPKCAMKRIGIGASLALNGLVLGIAMYVWQGSVFRDWIHPVMSSASVSFFEAYPIEAGDVVLLGDSITAAGQWNEIFPGRAVRNRGIGGDRTDDLLARLDGIVAVPAAKLFLKIGTNDLGTGVAPEAIVANYEELLDRIAEAQPTTTVYVQSVLPRAADYRMRVESLNERLRALATQRGLAYVDLYPAFLAEDGSIRDEFTYDELHLSGAGYREWQRLLAPYLE